jgi:uncharacterized protein (TIGR02996 family)
VVTAEEMSFLRALEADPTDRTTLLAYADWLEEHDRPYRAMLQRVQAGVSQVRFKVRRKSDGLFAERGTRHVQWSSGGVEWERLSSVRAHLAAGSHNKLYGDNTPWDDVEIVAFEVRVQAVGTLPFSIQEGRWRGSKKVSITEPA